MTALAAPRARAFMSVKTQYDNLGDALINRELGLLLSERVPTTVDFSRCPASFRRTMGLDGLPNVEVLKRHGFARLVGRMLASRLRGERPYLFLNPGGLGGKRKRPKQILAASAYNLLLSALSFAGVRVCQTGVSFDPLDGTDRLLTRWRNGILFSATVRDEASFHYLRANRIRVDEIVPDLSFHLYSSAPADALPRDAIALSFRFDRNYATVEAMQQSVLRLIEMRGRDRRYKFVAQVGRDAEPMRTLYDWCVQQPGLRCEWLSCSDDIARVQRGYADCSAIYSNRLHALLLGAHAGASPYALVRSGSQVKITALFDDMGWREQLIHLGEEATAPARDVPCDRSRVLIEAGRLAGYFDRVLTRP